MQSSDRAVPGILVHKGGSCLREARTPVGCGQMPRPMRLVPFVQSALYAAEVTRAPASDATSAPADLVALASGLVHRYPECFWFWRPDAPIRSLDDVRLVVRQLRDYGGRDAWLAAQDLSPCLSARSRRTS